MMDECRNLLESHDIRVFVKYCYSTRIHVSDESIGAMVKYSKPCRNVVCTSGDYANNISCLWGAKLELEQVTHVKCGRMGGSEESSLF